MRRPPTPNPFSEFLVLLAFVGALYMAIAGLAYEAEVWSLVPRGADLSWNHAFDSLTAPDASPAPRRYR